MDHPLRDKDGNFTQVDGLLGIKNSYKVNQIECNHRKMSALSNFSRRQTIMSLPLSFQALPLLGMYLFNIKVLETCNICFSGTSEKKGKTN